jgi:LysM repeat protein
MFYRVWIVVRTLIILAAIGAIVGAVAIRMTLDNDAQVNELYNVQLTVQVGTAVANALNNATRTAEAPLRQYRYIVVSSDESLEEVAERYNTTVDVIRMANGLAPNVSTGDGNKLVIPENLQTLDPPRRLLAIEARFGDTLEQIAATYDIAERILLADNPVLSDRPLLPGDIVYVAQLL